MKTLVTQRSPCYSAVSAWLTIPLPDRSNYSPLLPHPLLHSGSIVSSGQTLYQTTPLETNTSLLQRFTAESSRELRRNAVPRTTSRGKCRCSFPPLQIVNSVPFCLFYLYPLSAPFLNPLSSPYPPSLLSLLINYLSS